jgi:CheY-like chemotaxis protein
MKVGRKRILIVDPDKEAGEELSLLFADEDFDVEKTGSITKAAERVKDVKFDCVIMDVELPKMKGYDAVPILKTIDPKLQIIMTATENTLELETNVRKQDIFFYYLKSFDKKELKEAVRDVFRKTGKIRESRKMDGPANILIVDDDRDFVKAITTILKYEGYKVEAAYNMSEAMEKIESAAPDLILLNIMLKKSDDGFICYKLKHDPELRKIPVLALSAMNQAVSFEFSPEQDGEYFKADDFIEKPVKPTELLKRIEKLL